MTRRDGAKTAPAQVSEDRPIPRKETPTSPAACYCFMEMDEAPPSLDFSNLFMSRLSFVVTLLLLWAGFAGATQAQVRPRLDAVNVLSAEARARLAPADTSLAFRTRLVAGGRLEEDTGIFRAAYRLDAPAKPGAAPDVAARAYLREAARAFGLDPETTDLEVARVEATAETRHVLFRQTFHGLPVFHRHVKVSLDRDGAPTMVLNAYASHLHDVRDFDARPALSARDAAATALGHVARGRGRTSTPELVVFPADPPRLAWRLLAWPDDVPAEWSVLIDAHTGALLYLFDQAMRERAGDGAEAATLFGAEGAGPDAGRAAERALVRRRIDGTGYVFDPDPLSTSGQTYTPPYVDNDDADNSALDAERVLVDLHDLAQGSDGLFRLEGPFVRIDGSSATNFTPPAEPDPNGFRYTRAQPGFEAVMAYYHIDKSQRHIQDLGIFDVQNGPLPVQPRARTDDNSFYFPGSNRIEFGTGGVDDAEDAFVIWHEYGHAVLEAGAPGLLVTPEGQALHEGWGDYWAASYTRSLIEEGVSKRQDWEQLFKWDSGDGAPELWGGRRLDHPGHYPEDTPCAQGNTSCDIWTDGTLWATTLMEIYDALGRSVLDQLNLFSHAYLAAPVTMADAAEAIIQADLDHFDGAHVSVLLDRFGARGFVNPSNFGPIISHDALPSTEQTGGVVPIEVEAVGASAPVDSVFVFFGVDAEPSERLALAPAGDDRFRGELPLPETAGTVRYYIEAVDALGRRTLLPTAAPVETFSFTAGPDLEAPEIMHDPITTASLAVWPVEVTATVTDNLGVDSVWVAFAIETAEGVVTAEGAFGLTGEAGVYRGTFPVPVGQIRRNSVVRYELHARDRAQAANETVLPASDRYAFPVTAEGILRAFNFEASEQDVTATGVWARGTPAFGVKVAHSGQFVWATAPTAAYPATAGLSSLELPPLNLEGLGQVYLVFWHWYDLEHNGLAEPDRRRQGRILWDGANVKVSTDGGATWIVLEPEGGYSGVVFDTPENPLRNQPAFGGYSFGWRQEVVPLPEAADVRLRFDFGTDAGNSEIAVDFAGWCLDDVTVTTEPPADTRAPGVAEEPAALTVRDVRDPLPPIILQIDDDTGVAEALAPYEVVTATGTVADTLRLAMRPTDLLVYEGQIPTTRTLRPGDAIEYRLILRDFAGNETVLPAASEAPYRIEYRLVETPDALAGVSASGLWRASGASWVTTEDEPPEARSSLVLEPFDLPANAADLTFTLEHRYTLGAGLGGNVKVSTDDGRTWTVLTPEGGYPATFPPGDGHPMEGEPVFAGASGGFAQTSFDLAAYAGAQVRLRIDLGATRPPGPGEFWQIQAATFGQSTRDEAFEIPRELRLLANFPDPFSAATTISYTLPESMPVTMEVFDVLGRRVALLVNAVEEAGTHTLTFDGSRLAGGVYVLRLVAGGAQRIERMVVAR